MKTGVGTFEAGKYLLILVNINFTNNLLTIEYIFFISLKNYKKYIYRLISHLIRVPTIE